VHSGRQQFIANGQTGGGHFMLLWG